MTFLSALFLYRVANRLDKWNVPLLPWIFEKLILLIYRCVVPRRCEIGEGTELGYGGIAVVIHERAKIGRNVGIGSCVTIGGRSGIVGVPVIEDGASIGTGAKVLGDIRIGKRAVIGANAVVIKSVPDDAVVVGVPAHVVRIQTRHEE